jgi:hypothetical protein
MAFKTLNSSDQNFQLLQDNIQAALPAETSSILITQDAQGRANIVRDTLSGLFSGGTLIKLPLKSGQDNLVPHGLNRVPSVWIVAGVDANATIWTQATAQLKNQTGAAQNANSVYLNLLCSANCNATVWVN